MDNHFLAFLRNVVHAKQDLYVQVQNQLSFSWGPKESSWLILPAKLAILDNERKRSCVSFANNNTSESTSKK